MKILFFTPKNLVSPLSLTNYHFPLGALYVATAIQNKGYDIKFFDMTFYDFKLVPKIIRQEKPSVVCINSYTKNRFEALEIARVAKSIEPKIKTVMGGIHATNLPEQITTYYQIDIVVNGLGEITVVELLKALKKIEI